ncbi:hypothetical protein [Methanobrevibacter millerae]|uniref:Uncharacterized protein n=1 Tax=Methanobrevibacter millerae TaxID=230361 RepID=A0A1G5WH43_9EURY|nr:hypothetical protein [Methanobrevibacter millerae]SDA57006.1 hypothetical protein SAMN02910315_01382 [Methanobrevibacter millerae]
MCIDLLNNPTVIGAIIGAIVGAIASAAFAIATSLYKFNKRKKGAKSLIKSETNHIIDALEKFKDKYLKNEIKLDDVDKSINELFNFYNMMHNFPIWTDRNWINLINFIPSIFNEEEINKINQFYAKCEEMSDAANALADKEPFNELSIEGQPTRKIPMPLKDINSHRNMFRKDLNELIKMGNEVKLIFD